MGKFTVQLHVYSRIYSSHMLQLQLQFVCAVKTLYIFSIVKFTNIDNFLKYPIRYHYGHLLGLRSSFSPTSPGLMSETYSHVGQI